MGSLLILLAAKAKLSNVLFNIFMIMGIWTGRVMFDWYLKHKEEKENGVIFTTKSYILIGLRVTAVFVLNISIIVGSYFLFIAN